MTEEEYIYRLNEAKIDYDNCVLKTTTTTSRYAEQYAQAGSFDYLFSDCSYWPLGRSSCKITKADGLFTDLNPLQNTPELDWQFTIFDEGLTLLKNPAPLHEALLARGETEVLDAKLFGMTHYLSFLYLKGAQDEYLVKLYDGTYGELPQIELYTLYPVTEVLEAIAPIAEVQAPLIAVGWHKRRQSPSPPTKRRAMQLMEAGLIRATKRGLTR